MRFDQIKFETVTTSNPQQRLKHHLSFSILYWVFSGFCFILIVAGAISAALTQIWALFTLLAVGFIFLPICVIAACWHMSRYSEATLVCNIDKYIKSKPFHLVMDLARYASTDQGGVLFMLKKMQKGGAYPEYKLYYNIIFAHIDDEKYTPKYVKLNYIQQDGIGKINFNGLKQNCPFCNIEIDYENITCPYCDHKTF